MIYNLRILISNNYTLEENYKDILLPKEGNIFSMLKLKTYNDKVRIRDSQNFSEKNKIIIASNALCDIIWDRRVKLNCF